MPMPGGRAGRHAWSRRSPWCRFLGAYD